MNTPTGTSRIFTPEQANATLPLLKLIVGDIVTLSRSVVQTRETLDSMRKRAGSNASEKYREEVDDIESKLAEDVHQLQSFVAELHELGVEPKVLTEGLVDFPAMIGGEIVNLCWKHGEEKIEFWHTLEEGFGGRKPIAGETFQIHTSN